MFLSGRKTALCRKAREKRDRSDQTAETSARGNRQSARQRQNRPQDYEKELEDRISTAFKVSGRGGKSRRNGGFKFFRRKGVPHGPVGKYQYHQRKKTLPAENGMQRAASLEENTVFSQSAGRTPLAPVP